GAGGRLGEEAGGAERGGGVLGVAPTGGDDLAVRLGTPVRQRPPRPAGGPPVRAERVRAAQGQPPPQGILLLQGIEQRLLVVAEERDQPALPGKAEQPVQHPAACPPPVAVIAPR